MVDPADAAATEPLQAESDGGGSGEPPVNPDEEATELQELLRQMGDPAVRRVSTDAKKACMDISKMQFERKAAGAAEQMGDPAVRNGVCKTTPCMTSCEVRIRQVACADALQLQAAARSSC